MKLCPLLTIGVKALKALSIDSIARLFSQEQWSRLRQLRQRLRVLQGSVRAASQQEVQELVRDVEHRLRLEAEESRQVYELLAQEEWNLEASLQARRGGRFRPSS